MVPSSILWDEATVSQSSRTGPKMLRVNGRNARDQIINSKILPTGMLSIAREKNIGVQDHFVQGGSYFLVMSV